MSITSDSLKPVIRYDCRDYSNQFETILSLNGRLNFWVTFHARGETPGKAPRKCFSFAPTGRLKTYLYGQKSCKKKERIEANYITTFKTLNLGLFAVLKKLFWRLQFRNSIQAWVFWLFTRPKKMLGIIPRLRIWCSYGKIWTNKSLNLLYFQFFFRLEKITKRELLCLIIVLFVWFVNAKYWIPFYYPELSTMNQENFVFPYPLASGLGLYSFPSRQSSIVCSQNNRQCTRFSN